MCLVARGNKSKEVGKGYYKEYRDMYKELIAVKAKCLLKRQEDDTF